MTEKSLNIIAKGAGFILFGTLIGKVLAFGYRIILSRLGTETYGELSLALSLISILSIITILGLDTGIVRYVSLFNKEGKKEKVKGTILFSAKYIFILSLIFGIILFFISDWINTIFFQTENLGLILKILAIALPFEGLKSVWTNSLKAFQRIEYDIYIRIIGEIMIRILLTVIFIHLGLGIFGASIAYTISIILSCILLFILFETKVFSLLKKGIRSIAKRKEILRYSLPLVFNNITIIIINAADSLMLGFFFGANLVGIYNVAIPIAKLILIVPTALIGLYLPIITVVQEKKKEFEKVYYTITKWIFIINILSFVWLIFYSKDLITRFFTSTYVGAEIPLIILGIGYVINSGIYTSRDILLLYTKTKVIFTATIISCITNIILNFILIPLYGMIGAAIATSTSLILLSIILFFYTKKVTNINPFKWKTIFVGFLILLAGLITKAITTLFQFNSSSIDILLSIILITTLTIGILTLTKRWEKEDKEMIKTIVRKIQTTLKWK